MNSSLPFDKRDGELCITVLLPASFRYTRSSQNPGRFSKFIPSDGAQSES